MKEKGEYMDKLELIKKTADDKLAKDIRVLDIPENAGLCDHFVVMTGRNKNHTQAIADAIEDKLHEEDMPPVRLEGFREGQWILMDCQDIIVHIFTEDERNFYNLEGLWN